MRFRLSKSLFLLLLTLSLTSLVAVAEKDGDKARTKALLNLAEASGKRSEAMLEGLEARNLTVPEEAWVRLEEGFTLLEEAKELFDTGDYEEALKKAKDAMDAFRDAVDLGFKDMRAELPEEVEKAMGIRTAVETAFKFADKIEEVAEAAAEEGFNVTELLQRVYDAKEILSEALTHLEEGNVSEAAVLLGEARKLLGTSMAEAAKTTVKRVKLKMVERVLNKTERGFKVIRKSLERALGVLPLENRGEVERILDEVLEELHEAREAVAEGLRGLSRAMERVRSVLRRIAETRRLGRDAMKRRVEALRARARAVEKALNLTKRLGVNVTEMEALLEEAWEAISFAEDMLKRELVEDAERVLELVEELLEDVEELIKEAAEEAFERLLEEVEEERWITYIPKPEEVEIGVKVIGRADRAGRRTVFIEVSITFRHAGFLVEWDELEVEDSILEAEAEVWMWTGPSAQVITTRRRVYTARLSPGTYEFIFVVDEKPVKTVTFEVKEE